MQLHQHDPKAEAAIYWAAVSLIVCEGLSIDRAAERLGVRTDWLRDIMYRRQSLRLTRRVGVDNVVPLRRPH
jgi:hypothetical protein